MTPIHQHFPALGTTVEGVLHSSDALSMQQVWDKVRRLVNAFERRFSRFQPSSELSLLNGQAGRPITVSAEMLELFLAARRAWDRTEHLVDPTIGAAIISAGYDVTFDRVPVETVSIQAPETNAQPRPSLSMINIDPIVSTVTMPAGVSIDMGGLGKGFLLDAVARTIEEVTNDFWVSLGGDVCVSGTDGGRPWRIGVQDPAALERDWATLTVPTGRWAIATSGTTKRKGVRHGRRWHHIIDPRTGRPALTDLVAVTVVADSGLMADALAKAILIRGSREGLTWLQRQHQVEAIVITDRHDLLTTSGARPWLTLL